MKSILNDLIICAGEIGSIVSFQMTDGYIGCQVKSKIDDNVIYDFYISKKEATKNG